MCQGQRQCAHLALHSSDSARARTKLCIPATPPARAHDSAFQQHHPRAHAPLHSRDSACTLTQLCIPATPPARVPTLPSVSGMTCSSPSHWSLCSRRSPELLTWYLCASRVGQVGMLTLGTATHCPAAGAGAQSGRTGEWSDTGTDSG